MARALHEACAPTPLISLCCRARQDPGSVAHPHGGHPDRQTQDWHWPTVNSSATPGVSKTQGAWTHSVAWLFCCALQCVDRVVLLRLVYRREETEGLRAGFEALREGMLQRRELEERGGVLQMARQQRWAAGRALRHG